MKLVKFNSLFSREFDWTNCYAISYYFFVQKIWSSLKASAGFIFITLFSVLKVNYTLYENLFIPVNKIKYQRLPHTTFNIHPKFLFYQLINFFFLRKLVPYFNMLWILVIFNLFIDFISAEVSFLMHLCLRYKDLDFLISIKVFMFLFSCFYWMQLRDFVIL